MYLREGHRGIHYSSVDSSAPSIMLPRVRVPSTPSTLFSIYIVQIVYLSFELECEKNKNKQKEAGIGPFFKKIREGLKQMKKCRKNCREVFDQLRERKRWKGLKVLKILFQLLTISFIATTLFSKLKICFEFYVKRWRAFNIGSFPNIRKSCFFFSFFYKNIFANFWFIGARNFVGHQLIDYCRWWRSVWPDWAIYSTLGNFSKPVAATIILPKSCQIFRQFCKFFSWNHFWASFKEIWRLFTGHAGGGADIKN